MSEAAFRVTADVTLSITVRNADAIERVTGPDGDEWRQHFYALNTRYDVLDHWTYNAIVNGCRDVTQLDGWADLATTDVEIHVEYVDRGAVMVEEPT